MTANPRSMQSVPCNLCGGESLTSRYRLQHSGIVTCDHCGLSFVNPRVPSGVLYDRLQQWAGEDVVDPERLRIAFDEGAVRLYRGYLARLERHRRTEGRRLLDIGCSTGAFLEVARAAGWEGEGLEPGGASAEYARNERGLAVHRASLYDFNAPAQAYDAVVLLEVIEHLEDPSGALGRISEWLKPGGLLLMSTPNFDSLFRRLHGAGWWVINCEEEHIVFFGPSTLRRMLARQGFDVVSERIRGCDILGILGSFRSAGRSNGVAPAPARDYYGSRRGKERLKAALRKVGALGVMRGGLALLETAFSSRWSPLYGLGEQLVFIAARRGDSERGNA